MSASNQAHTGPHAKETVRAFFRHSVHPTAATLLQHLDLQGFMIVPKGYDKPARRGNGGETGPLLGRSHSASLTGGSR